MSRNYGYVGRRSGGAAWQWIIIGLVFGFGCSVMLMLGAVAVGFLNIDQYALANLPSPTPQVVVITATPAPVTPTTTPAPVIASATTISLEVLLPTATPTLITTFLTPAVAATTNPLALGNPTGAVAPAALGAFDAVRALASESVPIEGGTFIMGTTVNEVSLAVQECLGGYGGAAGDCKIEYGQDASPEHQVTVSAYNIDRNEVTNTQFLAFLNTLGPGAHRNGCGGQPCAQTRNDSETSNITFDSATYSVALTIGDFPVTNVTWFGAKAYCEAIGRRLPTEAEWERAARGRNNNVWPWGATWDATRASTRRPASGEPAYTSVFAFPAGASEFGILNLAGNVAEWVQDWYDPRFYTRAEAAGPDPRGPLSGTTRVVRGGSWDSVPFFSRTVHRQDRDPLQPTAWIGFRCAQDVGAAAAAGITGASPVGASQTFSQTDLLLPVTPNSAGTNEESILAAPTFPAAPATSAPLVLPTLPSGG